MRYIKFYINCSVVYCFNASRIILDEQNLYHDVLFFINSFSQDAKKDEAVRKAYKFLAALHEVIPDW